MFDLGCGDGRVLCHAVQQNDTICCIGWEYNMELVQRAKTTIQTTLTPCQRKRILIRQIDVITELQREEEQEEQHEEKEQQEQQSEEQEQQHDEESTRTRNNNKDDSAEKDKVVVQEVVNDDDDDDQIDGILCRGLTVWNHATALYLYLLPAGIQQLVPWLERWVQHRRVQIQQQQQVVQQQQQDLSKNKKSSNTTINNNNNNRNNNNDNIPSSLDIVACTFQIRSWIPIRMEKTGKSGCIKTYHYHFDFSQNKTKQQE